MKSIFIAIFLFHIVVAYDTLRWADEEKCFNETAKKLGKDFICPGTEGVTDPVKLGVAVIDCMKKIFFDGKCGDEARWIEVCFREASKIPGVTLFKHDSKSARYILKAMQEECNK